ncbi:MAG TPA: amino acid adenylation domain-containing protein [Planctomycetaceae bacterium]|nr:amino acid adenylation domain-containing protein [Planctomycetaceae bacterium]
MAGHRLLPDPTLLLSEPAQTPVSDLFSEWVQRAPGRPAVFHDGEVLTYAELSRQAACVAVQLGRAGLSPGDVVAVFGRPSFRLIASLLGGLMSGGVILPIDAALPARRRRIMLSEAAGRFVISCDGGFGETSDGETNGCVKVLVWERGTLSAPPAFETGPLESLPARPICGDSAAYIFFTSGTSGRPKAIAGCHKSLSQFLRWQRETFDVGPEDRVAQLTSLSFDAVLRDVFLPLTSGAALALPTFTDIAEPADVFRWLERERVSILHVVPSRAEFWLDNAPNGIGMPGMRLVFFAGEPLTDRLVRRWRDQLSSSAEIVNLYGPTETTMARCFYRVPVEPMPGVQPIGTPIPHTQALVVSEAGRLCGTGEEGEIVIRTPFRTLGYLNWPSGDGFTKNPFTADEADRIFYTGDLGRFLPDGMLEILGRRDDQTKILGVRVEPAEVAAVLGQHPGVKSCAVVPIRSAPAPPCLAAYVVRAQDQSVSADALRQFLERHLPAAMVPAAFVFIEQLPLTPNGKLDRAALPIPDREESDRDEDHVAPRTALEVIIADIWRDVLGLDRVGVRDSFFGLGGQSLMAMVVVARLQARFGVELQARALFDHPTVADLAQAVVRQLQEAHFPGQMTDLERPDRRLRERLVPDRARLPTGPKGAVPDAHAFWLAHERFEQQARQSPEADAVICGRQRLTYTQLNRRANQLARHLRSLGVGPETVVGLFLPRSCELVAAVMAVLKSGGAYLPLDPIYPRDRLQFMLDDSSAAVVVTAGALASTLPPHRAREILVDGDRAAIARQGEGDPDRCAGPANLAYVIYTSGSTGRPKGVAIEHRGPVALIDWAVEYFGRGQLAGMLFATSLCFDLAVFEMLAPLSCGGRVIVVDNVLALRDCPAAGEVTFINTVPSAMQELVRGGDIPGSVRTIGLAGEPLAAELARQCYRAAGVEHVFNLYGPTEDTVYSTCYRVPRDATSVPIGTPIGGTRAFILDDRLQPAPVGVAGQLHLAGPKLSRGYWRRPELTAELFVPDPFGMPGDRLYRTGDSCRWRDDGTIEFLGRLDQQVKVRGYRVELGEIEAVLGTHPAVRQCAVLNLGQAGSDARLVAYVTARDAEPTTAALRQHLVERLPKYMVPAAFVSLARMPSTPNGKIDRRALRDLEGDGWDMTPSGAQPTTESQRRLAALWREVLQVEQVGAESDFFALGGHSLVAARMAARVNEIFGVALPLQVVFERSRLADLAGWLDERSSAAVVRTSSRNDRPFAGDAQPVSPAEERMWFLHLLAGEKAAYNITLAMRLRGSLDTRSLGLALHAAVGRHAALRTRFVEVDGRPVRIVDSPDTTRPPLEIEDLSELAATERQSECERQMAIAARHEFDLSGGPLLRARLFRLDEREHALMMTFHHIICDEWSLRLLVDEISEDYARQAGGSPRDNQVAATRRTEDSAPRAAQVGEQDIERQLAYWRRQLGGAPLLLKMPTDRPRPALQSYRGKLHSFSISPQAVEGLRRLARSEGATMFMAALAVFKALLARYSRQDDVVVGTPVAKRDRPETQALVGLFLNTLALRTNLAGGPTFRELLQRVRAAVVGGIANQHVPFEQVVKEIRPARSLGHAPLFQAMFVMLNDGLPTLCLPGIEALARRVDNGTAKFDLLMTLADSGSSCEARLEYNTDLFDDATATRLARDYAALLSAAVSAPDTSLTLAALPDAPQGSLDSQSLPVHIKDQPDRQRQNAAADGAVETQLCEMWCALLGRSQVGIHEDFFELGGDSLLAARMLSRIEAAFGVRLPLATLFQSSTIRRLADHVRGRSAEPAPCVVEIQPRGLRLPLFVLHSLSGDLLFWRNVLRHLPPDQPVYGLQPPRRGGVPEDFERLDDMAARYIRDIIRHQPQGPYALAGYSFGGRIAFEIARQLRAARSDVGLLAIIDTESDLPAAITIRGRLRAVSRFAANVPRWIMTDLLKTRPGALRKRLRIKRHSLLRRLWRFVYWSEGGAAGRALEDVFDADGLPAALLAARRRYFEIWNSYETRSYPGQITVFRADTRPLFHSYEPDLGWGSVAEEGAVVKAVPGHHASLLEEPNCRALARSLAASLDAIAPGPALGQGPLLPRTAADYR